VARLPERDVTQDAQRLGAAMVPAMVQRTNLAEPAQVNKWPNESGTLNFAGHDA
jgi:hypothetical protein